MAIPLTTYVTITVNLSNPGITRAGFGTPMVLSNTGNAWATPELTRKYAKGGFSTDFPSTTPEYAALTAIFAQPSPPPLVVVGKGTLLPTQTKTVSLASVVAGAKYLINVSCLGKAWSAAYTALSAVAWVALTVYPKGALVTNDTGKNYVCITSGTAAGAGGPTGTGANITDGTVHWMYVGPTGATVYNDAIAYQLVNQLTPAAWVASTPYLVGDRVTNDTAPTKIYECTVAGTSAGSGGPTGTTPAADGGVTWKFIANTPPFVATLTGSVLSKIVTVTATAGSWFALEPVASGDPSAVSNLMTLLDTTADPGVATDLTAILNADATWYGLTLLFKSHPIVDTASTGAAAWAESNGRLLVASFSDTACATTAFSSGTDVLHTLTGQGGTYMAPQWHPRDAEFLDACTFGYFLSIDPGKDNWRLKPLAGPTPVNLTSTQQANLDARRAGYFSTVGGQNVLAGNGMVESTLYGFIDTRRNLDWYATNLQADLVNLEISNNKVGNTRNGRDRIRLAIVARNDAGVTQGVIAPDPLDPNNPTTPVNAPYTVTVPDVVPISDPNFNPATRAFTGVSTSWKLANAINSIGVVMNVSQ